MVENSISSYSHQDRNKAMMKAVLFLFLITQIVAFVLAGYFELTDTEAYYWTWSIRPDLGYFDHPPMLSWVLSVLTSLFGNSSFVIRLPALLGKTAACFIFYKYCQKKLKDSELSYAFLLIFTAPVLCMGTVLSIPDVLSVPLGLLTIYFLDQGSTRKAAVALGLGLLSKWSLMGLIPYFLYCCWKKNKKEFLIGALVVFIFQFPVLIWNQQHDWATFMFQFFKRHSHGFLAFDEYAKNFKRYVGSQLFCFGIPLLTGSMWAFIKAEASQRRYFVWTAMPMFAISFFSALQGQNRYYWACLNMFVMSVFIVQVFSKQIQRRSHYVWGILVFIIMTNWALIIFGTMMPVGYWFDRITQQPEQYRHSIGGDVTGWKNWSKEVLAENLNLNHIHILASDFHVAAQITWALGPQYLDHIKPVGTPWEQHQFGFWDQQKEIVWGTLLVADDRYDDLKSLESTCDDKINWKRHEAKLMGKTIKIIYWTVCRKRKTVVRLEPVTTRIF